MGVLAMMTQEFYRLFFVLKWSTPLLVNSLIELEDVLVTAGGSELALTGGDGQVIKADHLACHQLDSPVQSNIIKVCLCKLTCSWCMAVQSAAAAG